MKRVLLLIPLVLAVVLYTNQGFAQNTPDKVKQTFSQKYPDAQNIKWETESATEYEANFMLSGTQISARFDSQGQWKESETGISSDALPDAVQQTLKRDYRDVMFHDIFKVERPGQTLYEVEVAAGEDSGIMEEEKEEHEEHGEENKEIEEREKNMYELFFTADGEVVSTIKDNDDGKKKEEKNNGENL
jgi:hypothetical protein